MRYYMSFLKTVNTWLLVSRAPFFSVGLLPFILGNSIAWHVTGHFDGAIFALAIIAVILIILSTHLNGECYDVVEDRLSANMGRNMFTGGSQVVVNKIVSPALVRAVSFAAIGAAGAIGLLLQFYFKTGVWTIPLGATGLAAGFFYSKPPVRLAKRGFGEILIGYCYGWLTVAMGFYLQTGRFISILHWVSLPIALTIFNVILINEFPDYPADKIAGKTTMAVRLGKKNAARIYALAAAVSWAGFFVSMRGWFNPQTVVFYVPVGLLSLIITIMMLLKRYENHKELTVMCGCTILVNLGTTAAYIVGVFLAN